jgi:hypothetical protein
VPPGAAACGDGETSFGLAASVVRRRCAACSTRACGADLVLRTGAEPHDAIHVFGVDHAQSQRHVAESVLTQRPRAVVMESAIDTSHESSVV